MANQRNRSALFTSRDTENSIFFFTVTGGCLILAVLLHAKFLSGKKWLDAVYMMLGSMPQVLASSTMLTIFKEGVDIMFTRYQEFKKSREKAVAEAVAEAKTVVVAKTVAETIKAYQAWEAWYKNGAKEDEMPQIPSYILDEIQRTTQDKNARKPR
jgi:hypothetical protein